MDNDGWVDLLIANGMSRDYINADLLGQMRERGHRGWREMPVLREANLMGPTDAQGAQSVLRAAALTYVAAAITSILQLLYYISIARRNE